MHTPLISAVHAVARRFLGLLVRPGFPQVWELPSSCLNLQFACFCVFPAEVGPFLWSAQPLRRCPLDVLCAVLRRVRLFSTPWTVPTRLLCPWDFSGKNTRVSCHFLLQGNLSHPGIEPTSPASPALAGGFLATEPPGKYLFDICRQNDVMIKCKFQKGSRQGDLL